eukprot:GHVS01065447.1.p1 GENE.GHVS01065447.1~~GHVS01065447.1.p1  ORF type:complete len:111 (+),score=24.03 GHVS01065447.1:112-444(+)
MFKIAKTLFAVVWKKSPISFSKKKSAAAAAQRKAGKAGGKSLQGGSSGEVVMEGRKSLLMCLRRNKGINWYNAQQVLKQLEVHQRAKPDMTPQLKLDVQLAVEEVRKYNN